MPALNRIKQASSGQLEILFLGWLNPKDMMGALRRVTKNENILS